MQTVETTVDAGDATFRAVIVIAHQSVAWLVFAIVGNAIPAGELDGPALAAAVALLLILAQCAGAAGIVGFAAAMELIPNAASRDERAEALLRKLRPGLVGLGIAIVAAPTAIATDPPARMKLRAPDIREIVERQVSSGTLIAPLAAAHPDVRREAVCLALNIYHEARGEKPDNRMAVGLVTLNRLGDARFAKTICGVIDQPGQFSWNRSSKDKTPREGEAWKLAQSFAWLLLTTPPEGISDPVAGRKFFVEAAQAERIAWMKQARRERRIGAHVFADVDRDRPRRTMAVIAETRLCPYSDCQ
jgi:hypothetical protein